MTALPIVLAAGAYLVGAERLWRRAGRGRVVRRTHVAAWLAGLAVAGVAAAPPAERLAAALAWVHMVQHLALVLVAPALLAAARPSLPLVWSLPPHVRRRLPRVRPPVAVVLVLAWTAHLGVLLVWHVPGAYEAALGSPLLHALEHASMLAAGGVLWHALLRPSPRGRTTGAAAVAAATTGLLSGAIGVLLLFSRVTWYAWYDATAPAYGLTALEDQQLAGAIMWVGGGLPYAAATCWLFARWLRELSAASRAPAVARSAAGWLLVVAVVAVGCTTATPQPTVAVLGDRERGRELVRSAGCTTCHAIPGVPAQPGSVGPPLDGFAGRRTIAGRLPNTPDDLVRWVLDPQEVDPGNIMPDVGLSEDEARAVAAFLSTLE